MCQAKCKTNATNTGDIDSIHTFRKASKTYLHRIGSVIASVIASRTVNRWFEARLGQTKENKIGICWFSAKHTPLRRNIKDLMDRNQDNVSEWGDISIRRLLFQRASTIQIQLSVLIQYKADLIIISLKLTCSRHDIAGKLLSWC